MSLVALLKKSNGSDSLLIGSLALKKRAIRSKKSIFLQFFTVFPLLCPRANRSCCSFLKINGSDLLSMLFTKERPWANRSSHSLQKSDCERFAPVALYKICDGRDLLFSKSESLFRSFAHKKRALCSKNQSANSQPCSVTMIAYSYFWHGTWCWILYSVQCNILISRSQEVDTTWHLLKRGLIFN